VNNVLDGYADVKRAITDGHHSSTVAQMCDNKEYHHRKHAVPYD
jgi:hypothetical protein